MASTSPDVKIKKDKKSKHEKDHHKSSKKRQRPSDAPDSSERKHKKSKSHAATSANQDLPVNQSQSQSQSEPAHLPTDETTTDGPDRKSKKEKRHKRKSQQLVTTPDETTEAPLPEPTSPLPIARETSSNAIEASKEKKHKRPKKRHADLDAESQEASTRNGGKEDKGKKRKHKHARQEAHQDPEAMDVDSASPAPPPAARPDRDNASDAQYPFFTQTVSQYLPLYPYGMVEPIDGFADQHLKPLLKRYVPSLRGVLLAYRDPRVGEAPGRGSLTEKSAMEDVVLLESVNEYAVSFGWLTVEVDLFRPTRGAYLEGTVNLQGEGHIGVVCWETFNAAISSERLPKGWKWISLLSSTKGKSSSAKTKTAAEAKLPTPEPAEDDAEEAEEAEGGDDSQLHATGYWVDENGTRIRGGTKLQFRIKNYEVGASDDYGYLIIEGTMLDKEAEKQKAAEEMERARRLKLKHGGPLRRDHRRLLEYSMTRFGQDETKGNEGQPSAAVAVETNQTVSVTE
ncbi:hypothetical protein F4778DRAFT_612397 [Xylariomycetidae sp. FL2044]|nr:hypothetical protein F4778DRAFT_612397 [Xylariomycetidae sp. FL2044]